jgi:hypothetical protein
MSVVPFAGHLAGLDSGILEGLLRARPDVLIEPVPADFGELAQRLAGPESLAAALRASNRDTVTVGRAVVAMGGAASPAELTRLLGGHPAAVQAAVADLLGRGLAWLESDRLRLPARLAEHWSAELGGGRPAALVVRTVLVDELRAAAEALGVAAAGLRRPELAGRVVEAFGDLRAVADRIAGLPQPARDRLERLRLGAAQDFGTVYSGTYGLRRVDPTARVDAQLAAAGLLLRGNRGLELPREVAMAGWLAGGEAAVTGRPVIEAAAVEPAATRPDAQAAVQALLRGVTAVLDQAGASPLAALAKGGVGRRERARLADRLSVPGEVVVLAIDLAYAAGLLGRVGGGYAPTAAYRGWRAAAPALQWARLAATWYQLEHAPTDREIDGDKELPPPLPLASGAGIIRRAILTAAAPGLRVSGAGAHAGWFCPLHGYDGGQYGSKVAAAVLEAERLGLVAADRLTEFGGHLVAAAGEPATSLAARVADLVTATPSSVIVQSDLTAVVAGTPSAAAARLLGASAVSETGGAAGVWRFTPASMRAALDAGWSADELLSELAAVSDRPVPQPLEYLVRDVARRHGRVRVREVRTCVLADEATAVEILRTRSLAGLTLVQLAGTVLASPLEPDRVLSKLRSAGFAPVAEDTHGAVIVPQRREHAATQRPPAAPGPRQLTAHDLATRLLGRPARDPAEAPTHLGTATLLAELNPGLDDMELRLLSDALENARDVLITYRDKNGSRSVRTIQPRQITGRWLESWCHLRNADREFTVANIESVAPPSVPR